MKSLTLQPAACLPVILQNYIVSGILSLCSWDLSKYFFCIHLLCQKVTPLAVCFLCSDPKNVFVNRLLGFNATNVNVCPSLPGWENHSEWQSATGNTVGDEVLRMVYVRRSGQIPGLKTCITFTLKISEELNEILSKRNDLQDMFLSLGCRQKIFLLLLRKTSTHNMKP